MTIKRFAVGLALVFAALLGANAAAAEGMVDPTSLDLAKEMSPGWNLGNALEATPDETAWGNPKTTQALMDAVKAAGFKTVRIPVSWSAHADADFNIDPAWMARVGEVVNMARKADLYVIVNLHWDGGWLKPTYAAQAAANARLAKLWTQIAGTFRDYDDHVLFAGTNEVHVEGEYGAPTAENATVQNGFNQVFVDAVRASGGNNATRELIVQGYNTNIAYTLATMTLPADPAPNRLMVEVHYYDPYDFALNDKSGIWQWGARVRDPSAAESWADETYADAQFEKMKTRFVARGVPVILGEYGAIRRSEFDGAEAYRKDWDAYITKSAVRHGLVPLYWDNGSTANHGMGLFDRATGAEAFPEIIGAIVAAGE